MYIRISVNNKIATVQDNVLIINGNSDYVIKFEFDAEWDAYEAKTARFVTARGYTDVVFSGDEVALPVITDAISVRVGVYAGNLHTTTPAVIFCHRCITDGSGSPVEPTPDVYAQIMERLNNLDGVNPATTDKLGVVKIGDNLKITKDGVLSVDTADAAAQDNTRPITSAAVYTAKSNIEALLGNLNDLTTGAKNNLVAAINEAAQTGSGGGGSSIALDTTLTQSGKAADAKAVGDALAGKQDTISDLEAIRSGAANGATALQAVPSTYRTATAQDAIDNGLSDRVSAIEGKEAGWDAKSNFSGNYNDLTNKPTIPTALPNPNALTFTGAVTGSYDGSEALTVNIPAGGGGGGSSDKWELINTITVSDDATDSVIFTQDSAGNPFALKKLYLKISGINSSSTYPVLRLNGLHWTEQFGGIVTDAAKNITISVLFELLGNGIYMWEWANPHARDIRRTGEKAPSGGTQSLIETINSVRWLWGSASAITNGSVFTLYGVRA